MTPFMQCCSRIQVGAKWVAWSALLMPAAASAGEIGALRAPSVAAIAPITQPTSLPDAESEAPIPPTVFSHGDVPEKVRMATPLSTDTITMFRRDRFPANPYMDPIRWTDDNSGKPAAEPDRAAPDGANGAVPAPGSLILFSVAGVLAARRKRN